MMQKVQKVGRENPRLSNKEIAVHHGVCGYNLCAGAISVMRCVSVFVPAKENANIHMHARMHTYKFSCMHT